MSIYQKVLGPNFALLPEPLRHIHSLQGRHVLSGWVEVRAPSSFPAQLLARCLGAPLNAQRGPIRFELTAGGASEVWTRHFPGKTMESHLALVEGRIVERLGAAQLSFSLKGDSDRLQMQLVGLRFFGVPCPRWLLPVVEAEETATTGRLHFHVQASLPLLGSVAGYQGHLELPPGAAQ